jgi:hypothetical protein
MEIMATEETILHYLNPQIKKTIIRVSNYGSCKIWAKGDRFHWYSDYEKRPIPMTDKYYDELVKKHRTLYSTLSLFNKNVFGLEFRNLTSDEKKNISKQYVEKYTLGIDIDTVDEVNGHGINIQEPKVKEAVEAAAQWYADKLRKFTPNSVYCLFSGGGIYVLLHHEVLKDYFERIGFCGKEDYIKLIKTLTYAINELTKAYGIEFFKKYPDYIKYVKIDHINGAKRVFKTIFGVHKTHKFAVIPLDPNNIKIKFEEATIPLKEEIIKRGTYWYTVYDDTNDFLVELSPYIQKIEKKTLEQERKQLIYPTQFRVSDLSHDYDEYPPCIKHILGLDKCGVGTTRALAFLATFLGHIEQDADKAYNIWSKIAKRWHAVALESNVFQSHYKVMHCASCATLNTYRGGFPHVDIIEIGACKPDSRCLQINFSNPIYYTDNKMYIEKLKADFLAN